MSFRFFLPVLCLAACSADLVAESPRLVSVKKIWDQGSHNAFTDLIRFRGDWFATFREADDHVGGDGRIRVLRSRDGDRWEPSAVLEDKGIDLRDPKLSITADGRLMIVAGGSVYEGTRTLKGRRPRLSFSGDGVRWTPMHPVLAEGDWLWRVTWHKGKAYGVSYKTPPAGAPTGEDWNVSLYESSDALNWTFVTRLQVPDHPNETTLRFLPGGECVALVRRETGDRQAWIGSSKPPYREWRWIPSGSQLGGPNFLVMPNGSMIGGGRLYGADRKNKTAVGPMTLESYRPELVLPSGGDNSYPGFVMEKGTLWMTYYSSHEGKTSIYLARILWPDLK